MAAGALRPAMPRAAHSGASSARERGMPSMEASNTVYMLLFLPSVLEIDVQGAAQGAHVADRVGDAVVHGSLTGMVGTWSGMIMPAKPLSR